MFKNLGVLFAIAIVALIIVFGPIATIWALNTLFPVLAIPYTFDTWCAAVVLGSVIQGANYSSKK
jgi:hypothetical protein